MAILVGMLDKEFQDAIWERGAFTEDMSYEQVKSYALNLAQKRIQRATQKADHGGRAPMDTSQVQQESWEGKGWGDWAHPGNGTPQWGDWTPHGNGTSQEGGDENAYDENAVRKGKPKGKGKG